MDNCVQYRITRRPGDKPKVYCYVLMVREFGENSFQPRGIFGSEISASQACLDVIATEGRDTSVHVTRAELKP